MTVCILNTDVARSAVANDASSGAELSRGTSRAVCGSLVTCLTINTVETVGAKAAIRVSFVSIAVVVLRAVLHHTAVRAVFAYIAGVTCRLSR